MSLTGLAIFAVAYALAVASPGPGVMGVVAHVMGRGMAGVGAFIAGIVLGDFVWLTCAVLGLAALAHTFETAFLVVKWAGVAYLASLAFKLWTSGGLVRDLEPDRKAASAWRDFLGGLSLTLGNPKAMAFFLALLPVIVDLNRLTVAAFVEIATVMLVVLPGVMIAYAMLARQAKHLFHTPRAVRILNRTCAVALAGAAATVAARG
ncbi:MAG: LysE family translocator [Hyphomicrobiales bacterium]